ncbi:MAG: 50S ribosomal protein L10 [Bacteroidetes bacterium]|jgi:large subunit ribosomal protein L10|nr:50S ribosomal protein L10 [Bacteroidota bacterium]
MPLNRTQKAVVIDEIADQLKDASIIYVTNFAGLTVQQSNELRGRFRSANVDYRVCKNTLLQLALDRVGGFDELEDYLSGPTAIAFTDDPAVPARIIKDFREEEDVERPELKAAYIEGDLYGADQLDALADLKSREELIGDILGLLLAPAQNIAGALQGPASMLAGGLQTLAEHDEE